MVNWFRRRQESAEVTTTVDVAGFDVRDTYLAEVVKDRSFAEIGGLWGAVNEKVSAAHRAGASALTMIDVMPADDEWWARFRSRMGELGIPRFDCVVGDATQLPVGPFDVIHCSGVLYHVPCPIQFLTRVRERVREHLVLTSAVIPRRIENGVGVLEVPEGGALFVPAMDPRDKAVYTQYWQADSEAAMWGVNRDFGHFTLDNYVPWWWLMTVSSIREMARVCGFEPVKDAPLWSGTAHTFLLRCR